MEDPEVETESIDVFGQPWHIGRSDFPDVKLYMYAHIWINAVVADFCRENPTEDDESRESTAYIDGAVCSVDTDADGFRLCNFTFACLKPAKFCSRCSFIVSRTAPEIDGYSNYVFKIDSVSGSRLVATLPLRLPAGLEEGHWRLDS